MNDKLTTCPVCMGMGLALKDDVKRIAELEARLAAMEQAYKEGITYGQYKAALGGDDADQH